MNVTSNSSRSLLGLCYGQSVFIECEWAPYEDKIVSVRLNKIKSSQSDNHNGDWKCANIKIIFTSLSRHLATLTIVRVCVSLDIRSCLCSASVHERVCVFDVLRRWCVLRASPLINWYCTILYMYGCKQHRTLPWMLIKCNFTEWFLCFPRATPSMKFFLSIWFLPIYLLFAWNECEFEWNSTVDSTNWVDAKLSSKAEHILSSIFRLSCWVLGRKKLNTN